MTDSVADVAAHGPAFRAAGVGKRIGGATLLSDLDFEVQPGEKVALIGPSGAGKTTLLRLLGGMLWPTEGRVESLGHDTATLQGRALRALRRRIGFVYQADNLIPGLRVVHNVKMGRLGGAALWRSLLSLVWPRELHEVRRALASVELEDKLWALPGTLSGGEQQRVALARLLLQRPDAILADEPVSALDARLGREVLGRLTDLVDEFGATLVVSLHDLTLVDERFDRVLALQGGRLIWERAPAQLDAAMLADLYGAEFGLFAGAFGDGAPR